MNVETLLFLLSKVGLDNRNKVELTAEECRILTDYIATLKQKISTMQDCLIMNDYLENLENRSKL